MAELTNTPSKNSRKSKGGKPDMTPMVDLGFLLITFFMFTTTFTQPNIMKLTLPSKELGQTSPMNAKNTLTLILGKENKIFWHQEDLSELNAGNLKETNYSVDGIRKLIIESKNNAPKPEIFTVIIKPTDEATYQNAVDALDEMEITSIKHFALVDLAENESIAYKNKSLLSLVEE
jgi:biopolymer transport protein ExbD